MACVLLLEIDRLEPALAGRAPAAGLLTVAGRTQVELVARAFAACGDVEAVHLAGPAVYADRLPAAVSRFHPAESYTPAALETILEALADADEVFLSPTNLPLLSADAIEAFLARTPRQAGVSCLLVPHADVLERLGELPSLVGHRFGGEPLVFAPLLLVQPAALAPHRELLAAALAGGLNPTELVRRLGVGFAIKLRSGRATLAELAARLGELLGVPCVFQVARCPELCLRVASRAELRTARWLLEVAA